MKLRRNNPDKLTMDMTPMIDVVFLLLIFFMVSTTFDKQSQIDVSLPAGDNRAELRQDGQASEVVIDAAGHVVIEDQRLADNSVQALRIALSPLARRTSKPSLVLKADKATPHGVVVRVMDVAASLGLTQIVIATQQPAAPSITSATSN